MPRLRRLSITLIKSNTSSRRRKESKTAESTLLSKDWGRRWKASAKQCWAMIRSMLSADVADTFARLLSGDEGVCVFVVWDEAEEGEEDEED